LKPLVILALHTGARKGELYDLMWRSVDLQRRMLTVVGYYAKNGKTRHIPLNREAYEALSAWKAQSDDLSGRVFPSGDGRRMNHTRRSWKRILEYAEISKFIWHDMRHTFASWLVMAGVELNTVRELLGHSDYTMTLRYAHLAPEFKAEAVEKICG
ncbi:MAG: site-specific integrase, partial [Rhodospirillaceae bacterium]